MPRPMKDSGVEWLGEIPADWLYRKCKTILSENDGGIWGNDPVGNESDKIVIRSTEQTIDGKWNIEKPATRDLSLIDYKRYRIKKDDLLITKSSGSDLHIGKTTLADDYFIHHECYYSNFLQRIRCSGYSPKLLWYLFNSTIIRAQCVYLQNSTSGLGNINADIISNLYIPVPPLDEQKRIATFLDGECARIDSVIEKTRASIVEYKKLKQAIITRAVTKGIRSARPMKDSGVEWLGEIPADWDCTLLKRHCNFQTGSTPSTKNEQWFNGDLDWFTPADFKENYYLADSTRKLSLLAKEESIATIIPQNTVMVIGIGGTAGKVGFTTKECSCNHQITAIKADDKVYPKFLMYWMVSNTTRLKDTALFTTLPIINNQTIGQYNLLVPPMEEQKEIAQYLDEKTAAIDLLVEKKNQLVTELERLKKSLIFEYVTGKKAVPQ